MSDLKLAQLEARSLAHRHLLAILLADHDVAAIAADLTAGLDQLEAQGEAIGPLTALAAEFDAVVTLVAAREHVARRKP